MERRSFFSRTLAAAASLATLPAMAQRVRRNASQFNDDVFPVPRNGAERRIVAVIEEMARNRGTWASVPPSDGRLLRLLTETTGAGRVIEVGTSTGYSGLFFSLALIATEGKLTTFEIDRERADQALANFSKAGVDGRIELVFGDAHENVKQVKGPVDVVFLDADKEGYVYYMDVLLPQLKPGGLMLAHNTNMVADYLAKVQANANLETVIYNGGGGLAVTLKKL